MADPSRTLREEALCALFAGLLQRPSHGPEEDFFDSGGHSLLAVRLAGQTREVFGAEITARDVFQAPTPRRLAALLESGGTGQSLTAPILALRAEGEVAPLFCVHPVLGLGWTYAALLADLDPDIPLHALQSTVVPEAERPETLTGLAVRYADAVRERQPAGPYRLAGWSLGGLIAHAMACELQRRGEEVELLALIDAYPLGAAGEVDGDRATLLALLESVPGTEAVDENADAAGVAEVLAGFLGPEYSPRLVATALENAALARRHTPGVFRGDLLFFAADHGGRLEPECWKEYASGEIDIYDLAAGHFQALTPASASGIALVLGERLLG
jgi:nonribosomal peptide synthetase DhbF